jgi:hypothetical protein
MIFIPILMVVAVKQACPILLLAGLALSAGGAAAQAEGAAKDQSAMNTAVEDEVAQQQQYANQGRNVFEQSLSKSGPQTAQADIQQGQEQALTDYQKLEGLDLNASGQSAPFQTDKSALNVDTGRTSLSNAAQAKLQGYSEWDLQQQIKDLQANGQLGVIATNARNTANLLPYQLQAAQHAGDAWTGVGSLLSTAGGVAGSLGALGGLGEAAAATAGEAVPSTTPYILNPATNLFQQYVPGAAGAVG